MASCPRRRNVGGVAEGDRHAATVRVVLRAEPYSGGHHRDANVIFSSGWQRICTLFHCVHPASCSICIESDKQLAAQLQEGKANAVHACRNGLTDCAAPILIDEKAIANLFVGQFLTEQPDEDWFRRRAEELGFDVADYLAALREVPVVEPDRVRVILDLLTRLTRLVTTLACRSSGGSTTAGTSRRPTAIPQPGFSSGKPSIPISPTGWKPTSTRR